MLPELVDTWKLSEDCEDARSVSYAKLNMVLIAAVKELNATVKTLQARISALEAR